MSEQKHTPGPWEFAEWNAGIDRRPGYGILNRYQEPLGVTVHDSPNAIADAHLIAAAPDLLAVCQELEESAAYWSEYDVPLGIVDRLRAALSKAQGKECGE